MEVVDAEALAPVIDFTTYYRRETRWSSVLLFAYIAANFASAFLYRHWLLGLPPDVPASIWVLEWGLIIPGALLAAATRWRASESRFAAPVTLACVLVMALAMMVERAVWVTQTGAPFFSVLNCYFLTAVMVMTGIRYAQVCLVAMPVLMAEIALSYWLYGWSPHANFDMLSFLVAGFIMVIAGWQVERGMRHAWSEGRYFETLSQRDPLTGLTNRRGFDDRARRLLAQAVREQRSLALAVLDLDGFKPYNDCYGHPAGDRALIVLAQLLSTFTRGPQDFAARIGGEEFVLLWYDVTPEVAQARAGEVVGALRRLGLPHQRAPSGLLTASIGAHFAPPGLDLDLLALLQTADENLYVAKQKGGDRCEVSLAPQPGIAASARQAAG